MKVSRNTLIWIVIFAIAMGYMEAGVVVYLREIYYPSGFVFPLKTINARDIGVELCREAATLLMLVGIGILTGRTSMQRFAFFLLAFGVWDIFYYVFLKLILGWPVSLLTWDILFLLPVLWVGPVLAPCILSLTMIALAVVILLLEKKRGKVALPAKVTAGLIAGSLIVIASFCQDPLRHLSAFNGLNPSYLPGRFLWGLFIAGEAVICWSILRLCLHRPASRRPQS
jgi:hypothetical protein